MTSSNAMAAINSPVSAKPNHPSAYKSTSSAKQAVGQLSNRNELRASKPDVETSERSEKKVLVFWATWCGYCKDALRQFETAETEGRLVGYKAVAVNIFDKNIDPSKFLNQLNVSLPSETATSFLEAARSVKVLPWVVLLDDAGQIIAGQRPQKSVNRNEQWIEMMSNMHQTLRQDSYVLDGRMNEPSRSLSSVESQTMIPRVSLSLN